MAENLEEAVIHECGHAKSLKFNAIGSGFNGGFAALCANYGVAVE